LYFGAILYEGTESCLMCHEDAAKAMLGTGHFKWEGTIENVVGLEGQQLGKKTLLNNFCVAVPSNEGRCTHCHTGVGWQDNTFDFNDPANVDCLICHDQSGTYAKEPSANGGGGFPKAGIDLNLVAQSIALGATPTIDNCVFCHANAGGGDNVKHGDISMSLKNTTREFDVHMGTDGANLDCVNCHDENHDPQTGAYNHGIAGQELHSVHEGEMRECIDCHGTNLHVGTSAEELFTETYPHDRLACQTCHLPAFARNTATKVEWYWESAGDTEREVITDPETGKPDYDWRKGDFVWKKNVRPVLRWYNGKWNRKFAGVNDTYDVAATKEDPIDLASPVATWKDPDAMIRPFKLMVGNQPVDTGNKRVAIPHLFGTAGGPNPYWGKLDWDLALQDGAAYTGIPYSGEYGFGYTEMLLTVNHQIAPAENALGAGGLGEGCVDCHEPGVIDWDALGWNADPLDGGSRVDDEATANQ
ncbi:MAG: tetrathionate reductase family octaheme c-type cytochrome, partial [Gammaproteobacteria bacterium]